MNILLYWNLTEFKIISNWIFVWTSQMKTKTIQGDFPSTKRLFWFQISKYIRVNCVYDAVML